MGGNEMKLANELNYVVEQFQKITDIEEYATYLKEHGKYNDFETRLAWDCLRKAVPVEVRCSWYEKYDCTDDHITTLVKKALKIVRGES
jgi:hypothetical protein